MRFNQDIIIEKMQKLGYTSDFEGCCFGICVMVMQFMLLEEPRKVNALLYELENNQDVDKLDVDARAFLEGIEIAQNTALYADYIESFSSAQEIMQVSRLIALSRIDEIGGFTKLNESTGLFTQNDLRDSLHLFKTKLSNQSHPIVSTYYTAGHIIVISYHPQKDVWYFCDSEALPLVSFRSEAALAEQIFSAFSTEEREDGIYYYGDQPIKEAKMMLGLHIIGLQCNQLIQEPLIDEWLTDPLLTSRTAYTKEKDSNKTSYLDISASCGVTRLARIIKENALDVEEIGDALRIAISYNDRASTELLLTTFRRFLPDELLKQLFMLAIEKRSDNALSVIMQHGTFLDNDVLIDGLFHAFLERATRCIERLAERIPAGEEAIFQRELVRRAMSINNPELLEYLLNELDIPCHLISSLFTDVIEEMQPAIFQVFCEKYSPHERAPTPTPVFF